MIRGDSYVYESTSLGLFMSTPLSFESHRFVTAPNFTGGKPAGRLVGMGRAAEEKELIGKPRVEH